MKNYSKLTKEKAKCPHKVSKSPHKPKTVRYHTTNFQDYQTKIIDPPIRTITKDINKIKNQKSSIYEKFQLCNKQSTLCYYGLKQVIRMQGIKKQNRQLRDQNKKLKQENRIYGEYFREFEERYREQREQLRRLRQQKSSMRLRRGKIQELNSTLSGNTYNPRSVSHKESYTTRSGTRNKFMI